MNTLYRVGRERGWVSGYVLESLYLAIVYINDIDSASVCSCQDDRVALCQTEDNIVAQSRVGCVVAADSAAIL